MAPGAHPGHLCMPFTSCCWWNVYAVVQMCTWCMFRCLLRILGAGRGHHLGTVLQCRQAGAACWHLAFPSPRRPVDEFTPFRAVLPVCSPTALLSASSPAQSMADNASTSPARSGAGAPPEREEAVLGTVLLNQTALRQGPEVRAQTRLSQLSAVRARLSKGSPSSH